MPVTLQLIHCAALAALLDTSCMCKNAAVQTEVKDLQHGARAFKKILLSAIQVSHSLLQKGSKSHAASILFVYLGGRPT